MVSLPMRDWLRASVGVVALLLPATASARATAASTQAPQTPPATPAPQRQIAERPLECGEGRQISGSKINLTPEGIQVISGRVILECDGTQVFADEIKWNDTTAWVQGDVTVIQDGLRVHAERAELNRATKLGTFFNATGTARLTDQKVEKSPYGTMEPEVSFSATKIEKLGPNTYRLTQGWFTTCMQTPPRWEIVGSQGTVTLDERVLLKNAVFRIKGIPVLYLPIMYYPMEKDDRATGLLLPTYSMSNIKGQGLSNAFFWAIDRSQDSTIYYDYYSKAGQGAGADYRFRAAPDSWGDAKFYTLNQKAQFNPDGSLARAESRTYELEGRMNLLLPHRTRLFAETFYFSDLMTQQLYQENLYDFSRRDRRWSATLNNNFRRARVQARFQQRDIYQGSRTERFQELPRVNLWMSERPIRNNRLVSAGLNAELVGIDRQFDLDDPLTGRSVWRFDAMPAMSAMLPGKDWLSVRGTASWRLTQWTNSQDPLTQQLVGAGITRSLLQLAADVTGPKFARIFQTPKNGYAESFKHLIEPRVSYSWLSPFDNRNQIVQNDSVDSLPSGTATLNYGIYNTIFAKVRQTGGASVQRAILAFSASQSYYTDARAAAVDTQYQATTIGTFSNLDLRVSTEPSPRWGARFSTMLDPKTWEPATYSATAEVRGDIARISARWSQSRFRLSPTDEHLTMGAHALSGAASLRRRDDRFGGTYLFDLDVKNRSLLNQRFSFHYNAQCCGFGVEYQITNIEHLNQADKYRRTFNFTFTLAGIGSFSNPMGAFRQ